MAQTLFTIGYEGADSCDFWETLRECGVKTLLDVRDVPISRKPGFSKKALGLDAETHGIRYIHLSGLGDPKEGRDAAKAGEHLRFLKIFSAHLKTPEALMDLAKAIELSAGGTACLLCYERKPEQCHRTIVAAHMAEQRTFTIRHLGVNVRSVRNRSSDRGVYDVGNFNLGTV